MVKTEWPDYTPTKAAEIMQVPVQNVYFWMRKPNNDPDHLNFYRVGNRYRIRPRDVTQFIMRHK